MGVAKQYTTEEVAALLNQSEGRYLKQWRTVSSAVTNQQFNAKKYRGGDTAHAARNHLLRQGPDPYADKSKYCSRTDMVGATTEVLNKSTSELQKLDQKDPMGAGAENNFQVRLKVNVSGDYYGVQDGKKGKVELAQVDCFKLGENSLWIHTSYPRKIAATADVQAAPA